MLKLPRTDIIVVTYNAKEKLARCLRSVIRHTRDVPYKLTVVDNASSDGTAEYLKKYFSKQVNLVVSPKNLGFSGGANLSLRKTHYPWVALLDDDIEVSPGWFLKLYSLAKKDAKTGIVGGKVVYPDRRIFSAECSIMPLGSVGHGEIDRGQRNYVKETDALPGPCWLLPRFVIKRVGEFDERFFPSQYEDYDYCLRVRLAGYKIFYNGQVKITHHNLFRTGSSGGFEVNKLKFFKKWRNILPRFPLCPLNDWDRLALEGAKLFQKEAFCPRDQVFGKWSPFDLRSTECLYRGIAYWSRKDNRKAAYEFRKASSLYQTPSFIKKPGTAMLHYILSRYFLRIGMPDEAANQRSLMMEVIADSVKRGILPENDLGVSHFKEIFLHRWRIQIRTYDSVYLGVLEKFLPYYWNQTSERAAVKRGAKTLQISFFNQTKTDWRFDYFTGQGMTHCHYENFGIYRTIDKVKNKVVAVMDQAKFFTANTIFHGAFLGPLAFLLRFQDASLVHGALLQKKGKGILILGEKGAGKSTLSTACLKEGFQFFSDEHPILELKNGRVQGKSFVSPIALPAASVKKNFSELQNQMVWSASRQKYLLDPARVWPGCVGKCSEISAVIFPRFKLKGKLSIKRLQRKYFFYRLINDEYLGVLLDNERKNPGKSVPRRIANWLSVRTFGYTVEYGPEDIDNLPGILEKLQH